MQDLLLLVEIRFLSRHEIDVSHTLPRTLGHLLVHVRLVKGTSSKREHTTECQIVLSCEYGESVLEYRQLLGCELSCQSIQEFQIRLTIGLCLGSGSRRLRTEETVHAFVLCVGRFEETLADGGSDLLCCIVGEVSSCGL